MNVRAGELLASASDQSGECGKAWAFFLAFFPEVAAKGRSLA
jgi:hypothetical protein